MNATNTFCWNELATSDTGKAKRFYCELFGWATNDMPFGDGMTYTIFQKGDKQVGGMMQMSPDWGTTKAHWMPYIAVEDVDGCCKRITELGGTVCVPPTDISVGRFAVVGDPTGAFFSIIKMKGR
jgi:predicted enzyme related to lactoylglutathione lyase